MLEYRLTYAAIRCLHMKQGGDSWHNIGHIGLPGGCTVLDSPTHENQRNVGVVWIPLTMVGSLHAVGIVVRLQYDGYTTATLTVVTIHDAHLHILRNALGHRLLHITGILHATVFLQHVHHALLNLGEIQLVFLDDVTVEKHLIVHHGLHQLAHVRILLSQGMIQFPSHRITIPITRWNAAILQETGVVHRSMIGTLENQIVALAHLLIEI